MKSGLYEYCSQVLGVRQIWHAKALAHAQKHLYFCLCEAREQQQAIQHLMHKMGVAFLQHQRAGVKEGVAFSTWVGYRIVVLSSPQELMRHSKLQSESVFVAFGFEECKFEECKAVPWPPNVHAVFGAHNFLGPRAVVFKKRIWELLKGL